MTFYAMMRLKNEARWIERVIRSLKPLCDRVFVFDDHSTDGTPEICQDLGASVYLSPFQGINETRDKNWLLQKIWHECPPLVRGPESRSFIACIDGDEELEPGGAEIIRKGAVTAHALSLKIVYLWDREDQIRTDGIYGKFTRGSVFRMISPLHEFRQTDGRRGGANFHCGSIPKDLFLQLKTCNARLLHYGYLHREDRVRKYGWYNSLDSDNRAEDNYRHMVQGDLPEIPAGAKLRHAGPLTLEPLRVCALAS